MVGMATPGAVFVAMTFDIFVLYGVFAAASCDTVLRSVAAMRRPNRSFAAILAALVQRLAVDRDCADLRCGKA